MPMIAPAAFDGVLASQTLHLAHCWQITRTDGEVYRFTDHDQELIVAGNTYGPAGGYDTSAHRMTSAFREHDAGFRGVITDDRITTDDLRSGAWREAEIVQSLVDWRVPWAGPLWNDRFWISRIVWSGEYWTAEITGPTRFYRSKKGDVYSRTCEHDLGVVKNGIGCSVNLATFTTAGVAVLGMLDGPKRLIVRADPADISGALADNWFAFGTLTFESGLNIGLSGEIKSYLAANRDITMFLPFPFEIAAGDTFTIIAGCDRLRDTCLNKFANLPEHSGFIFMPATDRMLQTPKT